jgi:hypothetical protein
MCALVLFAGHFGEASGDELVVGRLIGARVSAVSNAVLYSSSSHVTSWETGYFGTWARSRLPSV